MGLKTYNIGTYEIVRTELIVNCVFMFIATVCLGLRLFARRVRKIDLWWDDWTVIAAMILVWVCYGFQITYARLGMRTHIADLPVENLIVMLKVLVAYQLIYGTSLLLVKFSYLFFYLRIFVNKGFIRSTYILMGIVVAWWIANVLQVFLICHPFNSNWNPFVKAHCANRPHGYEVIGAINMITDVAIWVLPVTTVWKLQLPNSSKVGVLAIFAIGIVICVISIIRMQALSTLDFSDFSFTMIAPVFWTVTEPSLAIINACLPVLRHLLNWFFPTIGTTGRTNNGGSSTGASRVKPGTFQRMQDGEYPLTALKDGDTTIKISASGRHGDLETLGGSEGGSSMPRRSSDSVENGIHVKKQWTVT